MNTAPADAERIGIETKGTAFTGAAAGRGYRRGAALLGMGPAFYDRAVGDLFAGERVRAIDLGCGPGSLCMALARRVHPSSELHGIDISADQLRYAQEQAAALPCSLEFHRASMDEIPFPDGSFDLVMTSMALHATPPAVRRATIVEAARVLTADGTFLLVDWSRPKLGALGLFWLPLVAFGDGNKDNWNNVYPALCLQQGLSVTEDYYLNSIARRQVFRRSPATGTPSAASAASCSCGSAIATRADSETAVAGTEPCSAQRHFSPQRTT